MSCPASRGRGLRTLVCCGAAALCQLGSLHSPPLGRSHRRETRGGACGRGRRSPPGSTWLEAAVAARPAGEPGGASVPGLSAEAWYARRIVAPPSGAVASVVLGLEGSASASN